MTDPRTILVGVYSPVAAWNIPPACVERLRSAFPRHRFLDARSDAETLDMIRDADVAFVADLRPAHLAAARRLEWIHSPAAGVGNMLFPAMIESGLIMTNSRGNSADTIAEHVLALTLAVFRKLALAVQSQTARVWAQDAVLAGAPLRTIAGSTTLIVGLGSIGLATARRMSALGARVIGIRRSPEAPRPAFVDRIAGPDRLLEALREADILVLAAPETARTHHLIGARELAAMRRDAVLVNVSRGTLVDQDALIAALSAPDASRTIAAAALDVFEREPLSPDSPLWRLPNVLITPHVAGFRRDHWDAVTALFEENLRRFDSGQPLVNVVNKEEGY